jgi:3',5'-nucleoside bisphosphate phosphatase
VIDLHMHTTASDGRSTPEDLVNQAYEAGIRTMAVTDHDTMAGVARAAAAAAERGMTFVPGIEITSVHGGKDVHVLAYFLPELTEALRDLLAEQRRNRLDRARLIAEKLAAVGAPIDMDALLQAGAALGGKSLARPQIAQALIAAGHASSVADAFERYLSEDGPAYVPHCGASPAEVVELIGQAGGVSSLAHPGYTKKDEIIPDLVAAGLTAIEAYHSSHDAEMVQRYLGAARTYGLAVSGGSDFHGVGTRRAEFFGVVNLPVDDFERLRERASRTRGTAALRLGMAWGIA